MWSFLINNRITRAILVGVGFAIGVGLAIAKAFYAGKASERAAQTDDRLKSVGRAKEVEDDVASIGHVDVDARLSQWMRDGKR